MKYVLKTKPFRKVGVYFLVLLVRFLIIYLLKLY